MNGSANQLTPLESLCDTAKLHTITMRLVMTPTQGRDSKGKMKPERAASVDVLIDGNPVECGAVWDLLALVASGRAPGGYYLGNCECGEPMCAGVKKPVNVTHEDDCVAWTVPMPYSWVRGVSVSAAPLVLAFDAAQYKEQTEHLLSELRNASMDGGAPISLDCYPGNLPGSLVSEADNGWPGYGGREILSER